MARVSTKPGEDGRTLFPAKDSLLVLCTLRFSIAFFFLCVLDFVEANCEPLARVLSLGVDDRTAIAEAGR